MNERPDWDSYFLGIAHAVSKRASCPRASVGVVIVQDNRIVATGYNGAPAGELHCLEAGCIIIDDHCKRSRHAEINAISHARSAYDLDQATLYCNAGCPCPTCCWEIAKARISRVVYEGIYHDNSTVRLLERLDIKVSGRERKDDSKAIRQPSK